MRAILLARAVVTSMRGLRASMRASHEPAAAPRRLAQRTTALAPRISNRRMVRSPLFEMAPSLCLPPVDLCSGVSPSQAAKSRPARKPSGAGTRAVIAVAAIGPMPGIVMSRRATGSAFTPGNLTIQLLELLVQGVEHSDQHLQDPACALGYRRFRVFDQRDQAIDVCGTLRHHMAVLGQVPAQGVDALRPLPHQQVT